MSRYNRYNMSGARQHELNQLESVIERKKAEIQAKIEAQKKKETEEALKRAQEKKPPKKPFWLRQKGAEQGTVEPVPTKPENVFSNDGSFLDQFKKLAKSGLKPNKYDVETLAKACEAEEKEKERKKAVEEEKHQRQLEREVRERERELRKLSRMKPKDFEGRLGTELVVEEQSSRRSLFDSNMKMNVGPPGVMLPPPGVVNMPPLVIGPVTQLVLPPPLQPATFTTNQIQLQAAGLSTVSNMAEQQFPLTPQLHYQPPVDGIPTPQPMALQTIPPPEPLHVELIPPPPFPLVENVEDIPPPPARKKRKKETVSTCEPPPSTSHSQSDFSLLDSIPLPNVPPANGSGLITPRGPRVALPLEASARHLAKMVATTGDHAEDMLRVAHTDDPSLRFLFDQNSTKYQEFRNCVDAYRNGTMVDSEPESKNNSDDDDDDDDSEDISKHGSDKYDPIDVDSSSDADSADGDGDGDDLKASSAISKGSDKYDPADLDSRSHSSDSQPSLPVGENFFENFKTEPTEDRKAFIPFLEDEKVPIVKKEEYTFDVYDDDRITFLGTSKTEVTSPSEKKSGVAFVKASEDRETKRTRRSRWGDESGAAGSVAPLSPTALPPLPPGIGMALPTALGIGVTVIPPPTPPAPQLPPGIAPASQIPGNSWKLTQVTRRDPGLCAYAQQTFGSTNLSEEDWKRAEDHYKINLLYQDVKKKRAELDKLTRAGKFKYDYDSDEDTEGGTWEHKLRSQEMMATQIWADELTRQATGKHHIGDFLPPDELKRFMEKYDAVKTGREPDLSDYKEFKLQEDNVGYQLLQKMGWNEGQGLGHQNQGIVNPVNKASTRMENQGLGLERPDGLEANDDEYDAYRKRMMLAYRFRPNPLNNPRRPYY